MKRVLVIGTGPSGFAVLNSLENVHDVWVMDGQTDYDDSTISTKTHLGLKMKFGSMHTYVNSIELGLLDDTSYKLPISYSRGGFGEIWGNGFTPYKSSEIFKVMPIDFHVKIKDAMQDLLNIIPFSHSPSQLDNRFGNVESWSTSKSFGEFSSHPTFNEFLKQRVNSNPDGLLFGWPSLLLDSNRCTNCGLCLTGCPYGALFDPGERINLMIASNQLDINKFLKGIVHRLEITNPGVRVHFSADGDVKSELFDEVILSTGPLSTALILMNSGLLPEEFEIPDSQVFYAAFISRNRIRPMAIKKEVSQMVCYPSEIASEDFQISFYSPSDLSRTRISQTVFPSFMKRLKIPKFISERVVPAIGFLPQKVSGKILIKKTTEGFTVIRQRNIASRKTSRNAVKRASRSLRGMGLVNLSSATQLPEPGSGFHIGASLPLGGIHVDDMGYLRSTRAIRVLDASILPNIPAGAHTFFSMALISALVKQSK